MDLAGPPEPAERVIQKRKFELDNEFAFLVGELPASPFYKGVTLTAGYTLHLSNYVGWQIASLTYSFDFDTDFKRELAQIIAVSGASPPVLPEIYGYAASHVVIKPFYGKQALRDKALVHVEGYLEVGPAVALMQTKLNNTGLSVAGEWLVGLRFWFTPAVSSRLELGQLIYLASGGVYQALQARIGIALNAGGEE